MKVVYSGNDKRFEKGKEYNVTVSRGCGVVSVMVDDICVNYNSLLEFGNEWKTACKTTSEPIKYVEPKKRKAKKSKRRKK